MSETTVEYGNPELMDDPVLAPDSPEWNIDEIEFNAWCNDLDTEVRAFVDDTLAQANRISTKIRQCAVSQARIDKAMRDEIDQAEAEVVRLYAITEAQKAPYVRRREWLTERYGPALNAAADIELEARGNETTGDVKLAGGTIKVRNGSQSLTILDNGAAVWWAEEHMPEAVKKTVEKNPLKKHALETGEVPDGCTLVTGEKSYKFTEAM